jgi:hypothetical protein
MDAGTNLTAADFMPYLRRTFFVRLPDAESYALELVDVRELGAADQAPGVGSGARRPFSLLFRNPRRDAYLPQHTYRLEFEALQGGPFSTLEVFLVPLGPDQVGMRYEAIFS